MGIVVAINGSPRGERGNTERVLAPFLQGMADGGDAVETFYANHLAIAPCSCGRLACWNDTPGQCCLRDDMDMLYPRLKAADTLVLATPRYIPLPGGMQNILNRLCPLIIPELTFRDGRTAGRFRDDVAIRRIALVAVGGWIEIENLSLLVEIVCEIAADASVPFSGALLRPHADFMRATGGLSEAGQRVADAARQAGYELATEGVMHPETLAAVSQPLAPDDVLRQVFGLEG
jgi:hypothetical protein